ncbi:MAG: hypothetical protein V1820_06670 [archaeon]
MSSGKALPVYSGILALLLVSLLISPGFSKVTVNKSAPFAIDVGAKGMVVLEISSESSTASLNIVEEIPLPARLEEWTVSGYDAAMVSFEERQEGLGTKYRWNFRQGFSPGETATLTYFFTSPSEGALNLTTIYVYPSGFDRKTSQVRISESRPLVFIFILGSLVLLSALYLHQRARRGEKKIFSLLSKFLKRKNR